jgi:hypothetical protein
MRNFAFALAAAACLIVGPAVVGSTSVNAAPIVLAQGPGISVDVGVGNRGRSGVVVQERNRGFDRGRDRIVVRRAPACRMITTRTRTPSGRIVIRETRRCG